MFGLLVQSYVVLGYHDPTVDPTLHYLRDNREMGGWLATFVSLLQDHVCYSLRHNLTNSVFFFFCKLQKKFIKVKEES